MWSVWRWLGLNVECVEMVGAECGHVWRWLGLNVECVEMVGAECGMVESVEMVWG